MAKVTESASTASKVIEELVAALYWTSGSNDFSAEGKASGGWEKVAQPAIDKGNKYLESIE